MTHRRSHIEAVIAPLFLLVAAGLALTISGLRPSRPRDRQEPARFTRPTPEVEPLRTAVAKTNLIICVIDAARADHVGYYGYPRNTTPNLDALAKQSFVFREHFSQYASTKPSTASLFTGQHADTHLAYGSRPLAAGTFTIARGLEAAGFRTAMFSSNPNAAPGTGLGLDFQEVCDQRDVEPLVGKWDKLTLPQPLLTLFEQWLQRHRRDRFFAYLHLDPPHQPYLQPRWMTDLFAGGRPPNFAKGPFEFPVGDRKVLATTQHPPLPEWINLYDANLRFADWAVGRLTQLLEGAGVLDRTVLIITSDHGEAFGEHGYLWHERGVYDELVQIPLLIRLPGGSRRADIAGLTQTTDLLPTIFDLYEIAYPAENIQGISLLPVMAGLSSQAHEHIISRSDGDPPSYLVRTKDWSLILWGNGKWRALYDLNADPGQRRNVIAEQPDVANRMSGQFRQFAHTQRRPLAEFTDPQAKPVPISGTGDMTVSRRDRQRLRALGYLR